MEINGWYNVYMELKDGFIFLTFFFCEHRKPLKRSNLEKILSSISKSLPPKLVDAIIQKHEFSVSIKTKDQFPPRGERIFRQHQLFFPSLILGISEISDIAKKIITLFFFLSVFRYVKHTAYYKSKH